MAFIGVAGIIGAGKTTLTAELAKQLLFEPVFEPVNSNPYLKEFYEVIANEDKESQIPAMMQIHLLGRRYVLHQKCLFTNSVSDRVVYEDTVFAKMLCDSGFINKKDFGTYVQLFQAMKHSLMYPNVLIYLKTDPEVAYSRIKTRDRKAESKITIEYLKSLNEYYEEFIENIKQYCPVHEIDWNGNLVPDSDEYSNQLRKIGNDVMSFLEHKNPFFRAMTKI